MPDDDPPDNVTPLHPTATPGPGETGATGALEVPDNAQVLASLDQWLNRLHGRVHRALRFVEMDAPKTILESQLALVYKATVHLAGFIDASMAPVQARIEELLQEQVEAMDLEDDDDDGDDEPEPPLSG